MFVRQDLPKDPPVEDEMQGAIASTKQCTGLTTGETEGRDRGGAGPGGTPQSTEPPRVANSPFVQADREEKDQVASSLQNNREEV